MSYTQANPAAPGEAVPTDATAHITSGLYHPELGERINHDAVLFHTRHSHQGRYAVQWPLARDEEARHALNRLKIRPSNITSENSKTYLTPFKGAIQVGLITAEAHRKLGAAGLSVTEAMLD